MAARGLKGGQWKILTDEWLTIRIIKDDSHRTRWPVSEFWQAAQDASALFGEIRGISRIKQLRSKANIVESNARGYLLSLAALAIKSLAGSDLEYGKRYIEYFVMKLLNEPDLMQEIEKRKHKYDSMDS